MNPANYLQTVANTKYTTLDSSSHHASSEAFSIECEDSDNDENVVQFNIKQDSPRSPMTFFPPIDPSRMSRWDFTWYWIKRICSFLSFSWIVPLLEVGNTRRLEPSDLFPLDLHDSAEGCSEAFSKEWRAVRKNPSASLTLTFIKAFGGPFFAAGFLKLCHDSLLFVGPHILNKLILFMKDPEEPVSTGLHYVFILLITQILMSLFLRQYFWWCFRVGMRLRSAIITTVYQKTLLLAQGVLTRKSTGVISNLMSVDSTRLQDMTPYLHAVWYAAFQIAVALYLLWQQVGMASLAAIAVIILTIPLTGHVSNILKNVQQKVSVVRDERVKMTNEMLSGIKVIKLQAWEKQIGERVNALRDKELALYRTYVLTQALSGTLFTVIPLLVAISTFMAYTLGGNKLDVATALTSLALFDLLRFPMFMLPNTINSIVEAKVSVDRIQTFIQEPERQPIPEQPLTCPGVLFSKASMVWDGVGRQVKRHEEDIVSDSSLVTQLKRACKKGYSWLRPSLGEEADVAASGGTTNPVHHQFTPIQGEGGKWIDIGAAEYEQVLSKALATENESYIASLESENALLRGKLMDMGDAETKVRMHSMNHEADSDKFDHSDDHRIAHDDSAVMEKHAGVGGMRILALSRINLAVAPGELIAIVGQVGSGKSSLISSILGDLRLQFGSISCRGSIALVGQRPFIFNATVKDNITNQLALDEVRYCDVIEACALGPDFKVLPAGDLTEIGERGINLSGGQKARVALARAMYSNADVFLLDDVLSAIDSHTATHIFEKCILKLKDQNKAILMSTNALSCLHLCSKIFVLDGGKIRQAGTYAELRKLPGLFEEMMVAYNQGQSATRAEVAAAEGAIPTLVQSQGNLRHGTSDQEDAAQGQLTKVEDRELGRVSMDVYLIWLKAAGGFVTGGILILLFLACEAANVGSNIWLSFWSEHHAEHSNGFFIGIYVALNFVVALMMLCRELFTRLTSWNAGKFLFREFLSGILAAPMFFFDVTPLGRVINRFSKDVYTIDEQLPQTVRWYLQSLAKVIGAILYVCCVSPLFIIALIPILGFYITTQSYYIKTSRELSRLDNISRSPIYALFGETIDGLSTVRSFRMEERLCKRNDKLLDENQKAYFLSFSANCWLAFRLEFAGTLIVVGTALLAILGRPAANTTNSVNGAGQGTTSETYAGLAGLAISMCLSITQSINWSVRMASDLESQVRRFQSLSFFMSHLISPYFLLDY